MATNPMQSNRSFGIVFAVFFAFLGGYYWTHNNKAYAYFFGLSLLTSAVTLFRPSLLTLFNRAWLKLGEIMQRVVSPIVLAIVFFGVITPFGVVMRVLSHRDAMRRRYDVNASSYWITRNPPGPDAGSFRNQF